MNSTDFYRLPTVPAVSRTTFFTQLLPKLAANPPGESLLDAGCDETIPGPAAEPVTLVPPAAPGFPG